MAKELREDLPRWKAKHCVVLALVISRERGLYSQTLRVHRLPFAETAGRREEFLRGAESGLRSQAATTPTKSL